MQVDVFILCYNESKMIGHTLNHYKQFCSNITIWDNESTDDSVSLGRKYFPGVRIERFTTGGQCREDLQTEIRNNCWKESKADYVIVCDMDELLYAEDVVDTLKLAKLKGDAIPSICGYNMVSDFFPDAYDSLITNQITTGIRSPSFDKRIIFDPGKVKEINFSAGSHFCNPVFRDSGDKVPRGIVEFKLLHYKYLGKEYLYERHEQYASRLSQHNKKFSHGHEYAKGRRHIDVVFAKSAKRMLQVIGPDRGQSSESTEVFNTEANTSTI